MHAQELHGEQHRHNCELSPLPAHDMHSFPRGGDRQTHAPRLSSTLRSPVEHKFSLSDSHGTAWATLRVLSNAATSHFLPSYFDGQAIQGWVDLDLNKPEAIQTISVIISGTIVVANANPYTFWNLTRLLWSADTFDFPPPQSSSLAQSKQPVPGLPPKPSKRSAKLVGRHSWSFNIELPTTCTVTLYSRQSPVTLPLPPSFSEKGAAQFIIYQIDIRIRRGPLRIDGKFGTQFGFVPRSRPGSPSLLRFRAYQKESPLVGPEGDPDGWHVLPPIPVRGKVFGKLEVEAIYKFAFASPLSYVRGSPIPCFLTVSCDNPQAFNLIFAQTAIPVYLVRQVSAGRSSKDGPLASSPYGVSLSVVAPPSGDNVLRLYSLFPSLSRSLTTSRKLPLDSTIDTAIDTAISCLPTATSPAQAELDTTRELVPALISNLSSKSPWHRDSNSIRDVWTKSPGPEPRGPRTVVARTMWWPKQNVQGNPEEAKGAAEDSNCRRFEGEILLPKDLVPSFTFGSLSVKYALAFLPFRIPGFKPCAIAPYTSAKTDLSIFNGASNHKGREATIKEKEVVDDWEAHILTAVDIVTLHAAGAVRAGALPHSYAPADMRDQQTKAPGESITKPVT